MFQPNLKTLLTIHGSPSDERYVAFLPSHDRPVTGGQKFQFEQFAEMFRMAESGEKEGKAWIPADLPEGPRKQERVRSVSHIVLDIEPRCKKLKDSDPIDSKFPEVRKLRLGPQPPSPEEVVALLKEAGLNSFVHTSFSHGELTLPDGAASNRYRIVIEASRPVMPTEIRSVLEQTSLLLGLADCVDTSCFEASRLFFFPRTPRRGEHLFRYYRVNGKSFDVDKVLDLAVGGALLPPEGEVTKDGVIDRFNRAVSVGEVIERNGYKRARRGAWISPTSGSGVPGVKLLPDSSPDRVFSHHLEDPLADGRAHDAFDCLRILECAGLFPRAIELASKKLGIQSNADTHASGREVELLSADSLVPTSVEWLWKGWLAKGKLHLFGGMAGTGKTTAALKIAACVTQGVGWPDGQISVPQSVVIWSGEDDIEDTLLPRLIASGADLSRVKFAKALKNGEKKERFDPAKDLALLEEASKRLGDVGLFILDPVVAAVTGDSHKNAEVRKSLEPVVGLAARSGAAVLGITHFSKGTAGASPMERITGSVAFTAVSRIVLVAAVRHRRGEQDEARLIVRAKSNIGPEGGAFSYEISFGELERHEGISASSISFGEFEEGSASELVDALEFGEGDEVRVNPSRREAVDFLKELLKDGPVLAKTVHQEAEDACIAKGTLKRAKEDLGLVSKKCGLTDGWVWQYAASLKGPKDAEWTDPPVA